MRLFKKIAKWAIGLVLALIAVVWGAITFISPSAYEKYLQEQVDQIGRAAKINVVLQEPRLKVIGLDVKGVDLFIQRILMPFSMQNLAVRLHPLSLISGVTKVSFSGGTYEGLFNGEVAFSPSTNSGSAKLVGDKIDLAKHPSAASLGITSGLLSASLEEFSFNPEGLDKLSGSIDLVGMAKPVASVFSFRFEGNSLEVVVPRFSDLSLHLKSHLDQGILNITEVLSRSSLGEFSGQGSIAIGAPRQKRFIDLKLNASLLAPGVEFLGPYLPVLSNNALPSDARRFTLAVSGTVGAPRITLSNALGVE